VRLIHERFDLPFVGIYLREEDDQTLTLKASRGQGHPALPAATRLRMSEDSIIVKAARQRKSITKTVFLPNDPTGVAAGMALALPLFARTNVIGVLLLHSERADAFSSQEENTFRIIADQLTTAIENAKLYEEVQQRVAELAKANKQLQELDLMKTHFIQNVSHELRTPLAIIIGYVDLLLSGQLGEPSQAQRDALSIIDHSANTLNDLVLDIMSIVEVQGRQTRTEKLDPVFVTREVLREVKLLAQEKQISFRSDLPPGKSFPRLEAAPNHFRRVVSNLLSNAIKFSNAGTTVTVRLQDKEDYVCLIVSDEGIGLTQEQGKHIFERFYRTDNSLGNVAGGTGLGLALVKEIVEVYGGWVEVESEGLGKGATFRVWWPLASQE
jgi:signal transduction histidine kinase